MQTKPAATCSNREILWAFCALTVGLIVAETSFLIQYLRNFLPAFSFNPDLHFPTTLLPDLTMYLTIFLCVHVIFMLVAWLVVVINRVWLEKIPINFLFVSISVWFVFVLAVLSANAVYYPNSRYALLLRHLFPEVMLWSLYYLSLTAMLGLLAAAFLILLARAWQQPRLTIPLMVIVAANLYLLFNRYDTPVSVHDAGSEARPNIFIIGIDSLRPDSLGFFGSSNSTPAIDSFLQQASVFSDATTPLARTYPAWVTILTGQHPVVTGARTNLSPERLLHYQDALPFMLQKMGYQTIYATDETRFNNIDEQYGFDATITPPIGVSDFIIGSSNDFPLTNLLMRTRISGWLFPFNYANRSSYYNYDPDSFIGLLNERIPDNRQKPLMMAVHFCLPHSPYTWASFNTSATSAHERYMASIRRIDRQLSDLFKVLNAKHLLDRSIVVLLSDHGETMALSGDRITEYDFYQSTTHQRPPKFYPNSKFKENFNQSAGHGTDVLGLPQYHPLLAFRLYGTGIQQIGIIPGVVSLMDVKPTLLTMLNVKANLKRSLKGGAGLSLAGVIANNAASLPSRHLFLESDYTPSSIRTAYPNFNDVVLEGVKAFEIIPATGRLRIKPEMLKMIIKSKQHADIFNHWMLAFYPVANARQVPVLVDLTTGQWTSDLNSQFAHDSPVSEMKKELETFYVNDFHRA